MSVASFTDAWIETYQHVSCAYIIKSHLLQMRGLKHQLGNEYHFYLQSHLLQMRGLKPEKPSLNLRACLVASFTDAWIETVRTWERRMKNEVASFTDAWIETVNAF